MSEELEYLLNEIKDSSQDYIGTNGCRYQDLLREELDLLVNEIERLHSIIKEVREYINHYETIRGYYEYQELGYDEYNYEDDLKKELLEILGSDKA